MAAHAGRLDPDFRSRVKEDDILVEEIILVVFLPEQAP
jgi:hypothetical protein